MRTKEEIVESIEAVKREVKHYENRRESMCAQLATLEAELAALPVPPVELVTAEADFGVVRVIIKGGVEVEDRVVAVFGTACARNGIDMAHLVCFITSYPIVTELLEKTFDSNGAFKLLPPEENMKRLNLARRYHDAMKGGAA